MDAQTTASDKISPHLLGSKNTAALPVAVSGAGVWIRTDRGDFLDGSSGALAANLGHGRKDLAQILGTQAEALAFGHRTQLRNPPAESLAAVVARNAPGDIEVCSFVSSGSDANELMIKIALAYQRNEGRNGRTQFVARDLSYHGGTIGSTSLTGTPVRRAGLEPLLLRFRRIPTPMRGQAESELIVNLRAALDSVDVTTTAAIVTEPVSGASGGALIAPASYYQELRAFCDEHDILLVSDEVMTGFGRTGLPFGINHSNVVPDILVLGKGISGGYAPLAGVAVRRHVADRLDDVGGLGGGFTHMNMPLTAAVGVAAATEAFAPETLSNVRERGTELRAGLIAMSERLPGVIREVRGLGLMNAVEFVVDPEEEPAEELTQRVVNECRGSGLLVYPATSDFRIPGGTSAVMVAPPLIISADEVQELLRRLESGLAAIATTRWTVAG